MNAPRMQDAASLMGQGMESARGHCNICHQPLATQPWWVTHYPDGEHTLCRDWSAHPFPFARHLVLLRRLWPRVEAPARGDLRRVGVMLASMARQWPRPGGQGVMDALFQLRQLRTALGSTGLERKLLSQL